MAPSTTTKPTRAVPAIRLELSVLVGHVVSIYSEQFPGQELRTRVLSVADRLLAIGAAGAQQHIDNLINNQPVTVQFRYKQQTLSVRGILKRRDGGRLFLELDDLVRPLAKRRWLRHPIQETVRLAAVPTQSYGRRHLTRLRWLETTTLNMSAGGLLVTLPSYLERDVVVLLNVTIDAEPLPALLLGRVRHCFAISPTTYQAGIEFLTGEAIQKMFPRDRLRDFPAVVLEYTESTRGELNNVMLKFDMDDSSSSDKESRHG